MLRRMCADKRMMAGRTALGQYSPQVSRAASSASDTLSDPIPEPIPEPFPYGSPARHAESSNAARAHSQPGVSTDGIHADPGSACLVPAPDLQFGAQIFQQPLDHSSTRMPDDRKPVLGSQPRAGTSSDMSSRDHQSLEFAARICLDTPTYTATQGLSEPVPSGHGANDGSMHLVSSGTGSCEHPNQGLSMLSQLFNSHATGVKSRDETASGALSAADCVGAVAHHASGPSNMVGNSGSDVSARVASAQGPVSSNAPQAIGVLTDVITGDLCTESSAQLKAECLAVRAPGHDPPDSERAEDTVEETQVVQHPDSPDMNEAPVAPLAAQLAKLYC